MLKTKDINVKSKFEIRLEKRRRKNILAVKRWREENPEKDRVHKIVFVAKRNGSLVKGICFCGSTKVEAHHEDYSKPLEVIWLCKKHHGQADKKRRESLSTG